MTDKIAEQLNAYEYGDICSVSETDLKWEALRNKTILITGAGGFIAYYLVLALLDRNDRYGDNIHVLGLVRNMDSAVKKFGLFAEREDFTLIRQDVTEEFSFHEKADFVIHAASQASGIQFEQDPVGTIQANLAGTTHVLEYARRCESEAVLLISSLKVYGTVTDGSPALKEEKTGQLDCTSYKNCYAAGKRTLEMLGACYHKQYHLNVRIARPSYVYGPSTLDDDRVWAQFIANVVRGEDILLKSSGSVLRSFCYVTDTAAALLKILLEGENVYPYNIASGHSNLTIRDFARTAVDVFPEKELKLKFLYQQDEAEPEPDHSGKTPEVMDCTRLEALGWSARVDIREGIRRSVEIVAAKQSE